MSKPLKVAICSWCYGIGGGAARMETFYYQFYNRDIFEPHIVSLVKRPDNIPEYDSKIPYIPINQQNRFLHLSAVLKDFDVIQFQGSFDPLTCEVSRFIERPHVLLEVLHNIEPGGLYSNIDGVVCVSNAVASVQNSGVNSRTICNGIDLKLFPFYEKTSVKDKIVFLQIARKSKLAIPLDELGREVLALDPRIEIWIVGDYVGESSERIKYFGQREDVSDLYRQADFTVLLSTEEPFGLVALESMASGTPVILSKSGGFLDIISNSSQGYLVEGPSRDEAINVIRSALSDLGSIFQKQLINAARKRVEENFSIEKCIHNYENFILELYEAKKGKLNQVPEKPKALPHAIVGEAVFDSHASDFETMAKRLKMLSCCGEPITEKRVLYMAHQLGRYLMHNRPDLYPRGLPLYLFCSGDRTEYNCNQILSDIEFVREHGMFEAVYKHFEEVKLEFPELWNRINLLIKS